MNSYMFMLGVIEYTNKLLSSDRDVVYWVKNFVLF